jgi:hypothetical protein
MVGSGSSLFSQDMFADDNFAAVFITDRPNSNEEDAEEAKSQLNSLCLGLRAAVLRAMFSSVPRTCGA